MPSAETYYVFEEDDMRKLREIQSQLHAGSDRERDFGHRLWLILDRAVPMDDPKREQ